MCEKDTFPIPALSYFYKNVKKDFLLPQLFDQDIYWQSPSKHSQTNCDDQLQVGIFLHMVTSPQSLSSLLMKRPDIFSWPCQRKSNPQSEKIHRGHRGLMFWYIKNPLVELKHVTWCSGHNLTKSLSGACMIFLLRMFRTTSHAYPVDSRYNYSQFSHNSQLNNNFVAYQLDGYYYILLELVRWIYVSCHEIAADQK